MDKKDIKYMYNVKEMEDMTFELRKRIVCVKMEEYSSERGVSDAFCFIEYLKENCNFKFGDVIDFENFKKEYLTTPFRLTEFNNMFYNSALDYDEYVYLGFGDDLKLIPNDSLPIVLYDVIQEHNFSNEDLTLFEEFVNFKYYQL